MKVSHQPSPLHNESMSAYCKRTLTLAFIRQYIYYRYEYNTALYVCIPLGTTRHRSKAFSYLGSDFCCVCVCMSMSVCVRLQRKALRREIKSSTPSFSLVAMDRLRRVSSFFLLLFACSVCCCRCAIIINRAAMWKKYVCLHSF